MHTLNGPLQVLAGVSGSGTTVQAMLQRIASHVLVNVQIAAVVASHDEIAAIARAHHYGVRVFVLSKEQRKQDRLTEELIRIYEQVKPDLWGQYGWMLKTPWPFIELFCGRTVNQHNGPLDPSLPGGEQRRDFGGKGMHGEATHHAVVQFMRRAMRERPFTEATAQLVNAEYDAGLLLGSMRMEIKPGESFMSVKERLLPLEWDLQCEVLQGLANGTIQPHERSDRLVHPYEYEAYEQAMEATFIAYPCKH